MDSYPLKIFTYQETGERFVSVRSLMHWLSLIKDREANVEHSGFIDFLIRQLNRELNTDTIH